MAKYFCGITLSENKYSISIIDDNLNIIFLDKLELERLSDLLKRKSVTTLSVDFPIMQFIKQSKTNQDHTEGTSRIKRRGVDNAISSKGLMTYQDRFSMSPEAYRSIVSLYDLLNKIGFSFKKQIDAEKALIEAYSETSFMALGMKSTNIQLDEIVRRKSELLKSKGIRIKDYLKKNKKDADSEANILMQAYTAFLYFSGKCTAWGSAEEGIIAIPGKDSSVSQKNADNIKFNKNENEPDRPIAVKSIPANEKNAQPTIPVRTRGGKVISEYCGAQYLYTNVDGIIRVNDLRPIKSYRPFTEIYEIRSIKQVQIIMCTTDGLRKVKANLIPFPDNSNIFRAADDEEKKKLDSFWGNHGDKRGYVIKFNKVDVIKA